MKFFVFIAILVTLWSVMRWVQQVMQVGRLRQAGGRSRTNRRAVPKATDLIACKRCGSYVAAEFPVSCGRNDCPYPGVG